MIFQWDAANRGHIARHHVTTLEAEQVLMNAPVELAVVNRENEARRPLSVSSLPIRRIASCGKRMKKTKTKARSKQKRMPVLVADFPSFDSEAAEATWWDAHPDVIARAFEQAYPKPGATQSVTIRLPTEDVAKARRIASAKGLRYQTVVKSLLHEALKQQTG
jgi:predicted DNA binding CopG/RHH family protein